MKGQSRATIFAITAVLFWSTVATAFKISLRHVDHLQLLFYSSVVSTIVLLLILLAQKKTHLFSGYSRNAYFRSAALGFLNPFLYYVILFKAYDILLAQEAQTLNYVWPLALVLLSIPILKQKINTRDIIAVFIS
ncbi:MAG: DMT family transporter, partial [Candidatus Thermoplasmatota archaeon]|nr:DMT family transporter [Candidatus Thermoplasmatota archaeon]